MFYQSSFLAAIVAINVCLCHCMYSDHKQTSGEWDVVVLSETARLWGRPCLDVLCRGTPAARPATDCDHHDPASSPKVFRLSTWTRMTSAVERSKSRPSRRVETSFRWKLSTPTACFPRTSCPTRSVGERRIRVYVVTHIKPALSSINTVNASCFKLLLFKGFNAILV